MGTSVSFRSPNTPKWRAVVSSYQTAESVERIRSELFNAGEGWRDALAASEILPYLRAVADGYESVAVALDRSDRPETVVREVVEQARNETLAEGAPPALAVTERALQYTLVSLMRTEKPLSETSSATAAEAWRANRGPDPAALLHGFLGEVLRQFALHTVSRDAAHVLRSRRATNAAEVRDVTRAVAETAGRAAEGVHISLSALQQSLAETWAGAVRAAFAAGSRLPGD